MSGSMGSVVAWPDRASGSSPRNGWLATAGLTLCAVVATALVLPPATFRAKSIVAITDPASPLAILLPRTAAEVAVSKPVMERAAESLIGTGVEAPEPGLIERVALALHIDGAKATGKTARLATDLARLTTAQPGALPGSLEIVVASDDAERAAQIAAAIAEALVAEQEDTSGKTRHLRASDVANRVLRLRAETATARRRLAALGGVEADPVQMRTAAAAQTAAAQARVDAIRAIIASGTPPLSDRRDVPAAIEALQTSYLDLSRQLAKARETLGDRHTTIISLQAEVKHASASLTAEWRRLGKLAESELASARDREASLRKADNSPADASRRAALDEARRNVQAADDAVARAQAGQGDISADERGFRTLSRPALPNAPVGLPALARALLAALAGVLVFGLRRLWPAARLPSLFRAAKILDPEETSPLAMLPVEETAILDKPQPAFEDAPRSMKKPRIVPKAEPTEDLMETMFEILPELEAITPSFGPMPTIVVAANEAGDDVTRVALALGRAVAESGHRVLLVETDRAKPELAAAASNKEDPMLVDLYGVLRVALRAETADGILYLAPSLKQGARIAAALARGTETPIIDEIGDEFDLVVIDGGQAAACAAAGWGADAYLRVGRYESRRDDAQFAETFDVPPDMILGTIVASRFRKTVPKPVLASRSPAPPPRSASKAPLQSAVRAPNALTRPSATRRTLRGR